MDWQFFLRLNFLLILGLVAKGHASDPERIVGGSHVTPGELPYQVHLKVYGRFNCGGSLITTQHVLTAAHCVDKVIKSPEYIIVVTGSVELYAGQSHKVKSIYSHPQFVRSVSSSFAHDIAVIVLKERINVTSFQRPISIATQETPVGAKALVSGWGRTATKESVSQFLLKQRIKISPTDLCQSRLRAIIYPSQICGTDGTGTGFCDGDSGGPLVYNNEVIGIVSWSIGCGLDKPDVYTKVYYYRDFIYDIVYRSLLD